MSEVYLGLNSAYHESSACLVVDGQLVVAVEEERFNRVRHAKTADLRTAAEVPWKAVDTCLRIAGLEMGAVKQVGYSFLPEQRFEANRHGGEPTDEGWGTEEGELAFRDALRMLPSRFSERYGCPVEQKWTWLPHHLCHAAGAYFQSGFEDAALLCIDGIGEIACTSMGEASGATLHMRRSIEYPHSVGMLWEKVSRLLGFSAYDASKTMSLAASGDPVRFREAFALLVGVNSGGYWVDGRLAQLRVTNCDSLAQLLRITPRKPTEPIRQLDRDVAAALQEVTSSILLHLARLLRAETAKVNLCLSGGVALNCQANYALCSSGIFDRVFVQPAANDAGTALGAALYLASRGGNWLPQAISRGAFLGTEFDDVECESALQRRSLTYEKPVDLEFRASELLAEGKILGRFSGRMEFGPRALGNRSFLSDPRRRDNRARLDREIKFRDAFRPYAPSVLAERACDWFDVPACSDPAYFMLIACPVREHLRDTIPAVIHDDGTGRVQLVSAEVSPSFHRLIKCFESQTGIPLLLNTSLNSRGPIVQSPDEALDLLQTTSLDGLILGDFLVRRSASGGGG